VSASSSNATTFVIDSLDGFKDSVKVTVVSGATFPVCNGDLTRSRWGMAAVSLCADTQPYRFAARTIFLSVLPATDTLVARPHWVAEEPVLQRLACRRRRQGTRSCVCGLKSRPVSIVARDSASRRVYARYEW